MNDFHSLLKRQIHKYVEDEHELDAYKELFEAINEAYLQFDEDRIMLERSLELSSHELIEANSDMRAVFQAFPDILFRIDHHGKILDFKTGSHDDLYANPKNFLGKHIRDIPPQEISSKMIDAIEEVKKTGSLTVIEYPIQFKDKIIFYEARFIQLENKQIIVIIRNITNRKKAEKQVVESEKRYRKLFNSSKDAIMTVEPPEWCFTSGNPAILEMFGLNSIDDFKKFRPWELSPPVQPDGRRSEDKVKDMVSLALKNGSHFFEWVHKKVNGEEFFATVLLTKVELNDQTILQATVRDITEKKQAEQDIKKAHKELAMINKDLEQKVNARTKEIQKLLQQKDEFIYQLGHDLKHPLNPLVNLLPIIDKHTTNENDKRILKVLLRNVGYMKNLVQKTLELSRLNSANISLSKQDLNLKKQVDEVVEQNKYVFERKCITLHLCISDDVTIYGDSLLIKELINNLLNNAGKYSYEHSDIWIASSEDENYVTVSIKDTGIGMNAEQLGHIFDEFYKADQSRHDFESSGLGIPICKRIVEKHHGKIWVESDGIGKGSTFYVTLPKTNKKDIIHELSEIPSHDISHESIIKKIDQLLE